MIVGGEGEVLGHAWACVHPWVDELWPEMVGESLATCTGGLQQWTLR
jgi:hypothetical protein